MSSNEEIVNIAAILTEAKQRAEAQRLVEDALLGDSPAAWLTSYATALILVSALESTTPTHMRAALITVRDTINAEVSRVNMARDANKRRN